MNAGFYRPPGIAVSEVRVDGARSPAKLFTYKIKQYALERARGGLQERKKGLLHGM